MTSGTAPGRGSGAMKDHRPTSGKGHWLACGLGGSQGALRTLSGGGQEVLVAERPAEDRLRRRAEPAVQDGGVDLAEVDGELEVAGLVEVAQVGRLAIDAASDSVA